MKQTKKSMAEAKKKAIASLDSQYIHRKTIRYQFSEKHKSYIRKTADCTFNIAEGAVRAGKTVDNIYAFAHELKTTPDRIHLATGSTMANAKLNIGDCNGLGLEWIFRGQSRWGQYKGNDCLYICGPATRYKTRIVIFAGGSFSDSFKKIRGNSYGMWIATEINLHHNTTIQEAFNRQLAAKRRKVFWDLNPDHPKAQIYAEYIDKYRDLDAAGILKGGYNYQHFTIFDNMTISDERKQEIVSQYDENSIWFIRDILGKRSVAEGIVYPKFAAVATSDRNYMKIPVLKAREMMARKELLGITVGVDFGGNGSGHAFVASSPTMGYQSLVALASELHTEKDIDPEILGNLLVEFVKKLIREYGAVAQIFCDSAEPVLIRGMKKSLARAGMGNIKIGYALKERINDRIFTVTNLCAQDRFLYTDACETLEDAMKTAMWNPKIIGMERLDDGTSDIDTMDAFEYSFEHDIRYYIDRTK